MVFGTFDILHPGHFNFFEQARKHGDYLMVVVARDKTVREVKHHATVHSEEERLHAVQHVPLVDFAVLGNSGDKYSIIEHHQPDVICLGYDQHAFTETLETELKKRALTIPIIRLQPYHEEKYKSSKLKKN